MTPNLPAHPTQIDDPIPFIRELTARDIGQEVRQLMGTLGAFANLFDDLRRLYPPPQPCPACRIDLVRLTDAEKAYHWRSHGWMARALAHVRRIGA